MKVHIVPVLKDNYSYLLEDEPSRTCVVVDPPEVEPIVARLESENLKPSSIWLTHHHGDHIAGVPGLKKLFPGIPVVCSKRDAARIPEATVHVGEGDIVHFGGETAHILELPGHAEGHIAYHFPESGHLLCGDVIFGASCGAVFGDTHAEMYRSVSRVKALPPETKLWVGHEYTGNNLRFAEAVLGSAALAARKAAFQVPSVPLTLAEEHETNPFMRLQSQEVLNFLGMKEGDPQAAFKALRLAKNSF